MYNQFNPYGNMYGGFQNQQNTSYQQRYEIIHVNGENGARAFQMAPNSNTLLLDDTAPIVWLAQTDGAGYKTVTPYSITPYQKEDHVDFQSLEKRISKLEEMMNNDKSNVKSASKKNISE